MDQVIGIMFVIVLIGLLADKILFSPRERRTGAGARAPRNRAEGREVAQTAESSFEAKCLAGSARALESASSG